MEEKKYPTHEEEESLGMVNEPVAEPIVASPQTKDGITIVHDWIDDLDWDKFPSLGPFSEEEAIARIKQVEKDLKDPSKWVSSEEFDRQLYEEFPWLR